ncbi:hypothetical protein [Bradyrhizobium sp. USDA 4508]
MIKPENDDLKKFFNSMPPHKREDKGAFWIGIAFVLLALSLPAYQSFLWLQTGAWTPLPISQGMQFLGWRLPSTDWIGLQKILAWLLDLPLWTIPAFLAFGAFGAWKDPT